MLIQRKRRRTYWRSVLLNTIPDLVVAAIITHFVDTGWWTFGAAYFGLQLLYLLIWLKNTIWDWGLFYLIERKRMARRFLSVFKEKEFPEPEKFIEDGKDYFRQVSKNKDASENARIEAAGAVAIMDYLKATRQTQQCTRCFMASEDAIELYRAAFPSSASRP
jgi:hypothetical protein